MKRPIAISLSPNTEKEDVSHAFKKIINPFGYVDEEDRIELQNQFSARFGEDYNSFAVNSGRTALFMILKALDIGEGDEVLVQAFTCSAAINPIKWVGAKPVYVDIDESYNLDPVKIDQKISDKTRAIIIQHTFGIPAKAEQIKKIAQQNDILLIEDCAVALGAKINDNEVGTFSDISFFSFGRDKIISSVWGGMILTSDSKLSEKIHNLYLDVEYPNKYWIFQQLLHPIVFNLILWTYHWGINKITVGKVILVLFQKLRLLSVPVSDAEKKGEIPPNAFKKLPGSLASLATEQIKKLSRYNKHRKKIAQIYKKELTGEVTQPPWSDGAVWLRYPVQVGDAKSLISFAKSEGILLGDWYKQSIYPINDLSFLDYHQDCEYVEGLKNKVVNLPTYPTLSKEDAYDVIGIIKKWQKLR